jgi:hypothetical protein
LVTDLKYLRNPELLIDEEELPMLDRLEEKKAA